MSKIVPAATTGKPKMSSREIAERVHRGHNNVKQSIHRLAERGVIGLPSGKTSTA